MAYQPLGKMLYGRDKTTTMANISEIPGMKVGDQVVNNTDIAVVLLGTIARPGEIVQAESQFIGKVVGSIPESKNKLLNSDVGGTGIGNCILYDSSTKTLTLGAIFENVKDGYDIGGIPANAPIPTTDRRIGGFGISTTNAPIFGYISVGTGGRLIIHLSDATATCRFIQFGGVAYLG